MNLITILEILEDKKININKIKVKASNLACSMTGTTASLISQAEYNLFDLLFGMMLPSGNDAAFVIS
jgi:D-alanyl-D-alanine carboxypeptidase